MFRLFEEPTSLFTLARIVFAAATAAVADVVATAAATAAAAAADVHVASK